MLVTLDTSVEVAELSAQEAQAVLARKTFERMSTLGQKQAVSREDVDRARADLDVAQAHAFTLRYEFSLAANAYLTCSTASPHR